MSKPYALRTLFRDVTQAGLKVDSSTRSPPRMDHQALPNASYSRLTRKPRQKIVSLILQLPLGDEPALRTMWY